MSGDEVANPVDDSWDWPYILFAGRVFLHYTEDELWRVTPRVFNSQLDIYYYMRDAETAKQQVSGTVNGAVSYVDKIAGW